MLLNQMFITDTELEEVGVTKEQIATLFHRKYDKSLHTTETTPFGIWVQFWQDPSEEHDFSTLYAESFY